MVALHRVNMIIVDYMQLMHSGIKSNEYNRVTEMSYISQGLKGIATELKIPLIACSQLSRAPEQRKDHRPVLSDLRDSGSIEQDADVVLFLYREDYYTQKTPETYGYESGYNDICPPVAGSKVEVNVAKNRNGDTDMLYLTLMREYTRFEPYLQEDLR